MAPNSVKDVQSVVGSPGDDEAVGCIIWHDGQPTEAGTAVTAATIAASSAGDLAFTINGAADTRISTDGTIDVSGATEDTFGEVYDIVNAVQGWNMVLSGPCIRATSSNDALATATAATCFKKPVSLLLDTDTAKVHGFTISQRKQPTWGVASKGKIRALEFEHGYKNVLDYVSFTSTYASGTSTINVYESDGITDTLLHTESGGATTAAETYTPTKPLMAKPNHRLVVQLVNSAAMASTASEINGRSLKGMDVNVI